MPVDRLALSVVSSWFAVGPALVLSVAGVGAPSWHEVPIYAAALAAQFGFDFVASFLVTRPVIRVTPLGQLTAMAPAFAVDAMLAPLGLLVAFPASSRPWTLLLLLPVLALFATFARERQSRIDHALELSAAYRGTAMLLGDVIEADDEYTGQSQPRRRRARAGRRGPAAPRSAGAAAGRSSLRCSTTSARSRSRPRSSTSRDRSTTTSAR